MSCLFKLAVGILEGKKWLALTSEEQGNMNRSILNIFAIGGLVCSPVTVLS